MAAAAVCLARGDPRRRRCARVSARSPASRTGSRRSRTVGGVLYVNDSKATNVASAEVAIGSFAGGVHLIAGGRGKGSDYSPLAAPVRRALSRASTDRRDRRGAARRARADRGADHDAGDLERAFAAAHDGGRPGDVVLLSPGCASYDQYRSYEQRGDHFRALVAALR